MRKYRLVAKKGEGTFSEVLKAQNVKDGKYHAIKCMKNRFDTIDQVCWWSICLSLFMFLYFNLSPFPFRSIIYEKSKLCGVCHLTSMSSPWKRFCTINLLDDWRWSSNWWMQICMSWFEVVVTIWTPTWSKATCGNWWSRWITCTRRAFSIVISNPRTFWSKDQVK